MGSPCPPHWSFAARAAYFGERLCPFCDHRNPPGASFCNECAGPLQLKPYKECDGINDLSATHCHKCGAASSVFPVPEPMEAPPAAASPHRHAPPGEPNAAVPD